MSFQEALYSHLSEDEQLAELLSKPTAVFEYFAPDDADPPFVIFGLHTGVRTWSFRNFYRNQLWLVKGVTRGATEGNDARAALAIDHRCEELLNDTILDIGEHLFYFRREQDVSYPEDDGGVLVSHRGGLYRALTEPEGS